MVSELGDVELISLHFVNNPVLLVDPPRPIASESMLEWLGLADSLMRVPGNRMSEPIDAF